LKKFSSLLVGLINLLISGCANQTPPIKPVSSVDLNQYKGDWFLIACIPTVFETDAGYDISNLRKVPHHPLTCKQEMESSNDWI
jgi:apolipoprotein D and lipocalin family protein